MGIFAYSSFPAALTATTGRRTTRVRTTAYSKPPPPQPPCSPSPPESEPPPVFLRISCERRENKTHTEDQPLSVFHFVHSIPPADQLPNSTMEG
ncbi:hypothetical protein HanHA300_Chr17g0657171 [Helianthus annuus]|nr:hypothetical protein HanHA300_Chr17g0657171 [Helianthus annuus]